MLVPLLLLPLGWIVGARFLQASNLNPSLRGKVVDLQGRSLPSAILQVGRQTTRTRQDGSFSLVVPAEPAWLQVKATGFLPVLRPVVAGRWTLVRLSPDDGQTLVIRAGGDVMAGRRFYTPERGSDQPPQLKDGDQEIAHLRLLEPIRPLLQQADLTLVNMETSLTADPLAEPDGVRSERFHPTKDYVFASAPALALALRRSGVDVVGLANDHIYDALESGLQSSLAILERSGYRPGVSIVGAGSTSATAWRSAIWSRGSTQIPILACTTIHGAQHPISYVASDQQSKGGAALCEPNRLATAIRLARRRGPVIVMIHGGNEYQGSPTLPVQALVASARRAGATLILNHHPHVLGGLRWDGRSLVADSLGNLLFDQTLWPTFPSMVLEVHLRHGQVTRAIAYPLLLNGFRPYAAVGNLADWILQRVAVQQLGPWVLESGLLEVDLTRRARQLKGWNDLSVGPDHEGLWQIPLGSSFCGSHGLARFEMGRDLLGVGSFEDQLVGAPSAAGALWRLRDPDRQISSHAAHAGRYGVRLRRRVYDRHAVLLTPLHRLPVTPGQHLSFLAWLRGSPGAQSRLQISWYGARRGPSQARLNRLLSIDPQGVWRPFRIDLQVPAHTVALGLGLALDPPEQGSVHVDLDDLALVDWSRDGIEGSGHFSAWMRSAGDGRVCLARPILPGGDAEPELTRAKPWPYALAQAKRMSRLRR